MSLVSCSVIVPVHNESEVLVLLQTRIARALSLFPGEKEVIYVNDASSDGSGLVLDRFRRESSSVRVIALSARGGQAEAFHQGLVASRGEWVVMLDADLQNPPEEIKKLWQEKDGYDYVVGSRTRRQDPWGRRLGSLAAFIFRFIVLNDHIRDAGCSLKIFKRHIFDGFPFTRNSHYFMSCWVQRLGLRYKVVPVDHAPRLAGLSKYSSWVMAVEGWTDLWKFYRTIRSMHKGPGRESA